MSSPPADRTSAEASEGDERPSIVVGLLADPDLPNDVAQRLADLLPESLSERISDHVSWTVETWCDPFEAATDEYSRLLDKARQRVRGTNWDMAICITDVPLLTGTDAFVANVSLQDNVALLSLPTLGGMRVAQRAHDVTVALVDELTAGLATTFSRTAPPQHVRRSVAGHTFRRDAPADDVDLEFITSRGTLRLLAGLMRANRPWQLTLGLSTALAGAAAGSAFGILYSNIWSLSAQMEWWRVLGATLGALVVFVIWLIVGHGLWERRSPSLNFTRVINTSTVLTVSTGVAMFYAALLLINLAAAALVIPPDYMGQVLGRPIGPAAYLRVALLASAMGLVAGAVGSGLEEDETVRRAAYSQREQERRARAAG
jgi:hypothetical protein